MRDEAMTRRVFDLPEEAAAKADPALTGRDEEQFERIRESLRVQVADLARRLETVRRQPAGPLGQAVERDAEIRRLASRLRLLQRFGVDLCLGRMVAAGDADPVYIGRVGLSDAAGDRLLVDWRAPAAEPFFAATHADPMGLVSRRRYRWTGARVTDYWDEVFTAEGLASAVALDDQSAFIASLGASRSPRMRDVLSTIAADQDAIVRADSRGALVVDGGPGTGKTVVALHRAAYLLYADPRMQSGRGGVLVIGPSEPYLAYVEDVLPSLGEDGVRTCTLRDLVPEGASAIAEPDARVAAIKQRTDLVRAIDRAVDAVEAPPQTGLVVETDWADVQIVPQDWAIAFAAPEPGTPHNEAREEVWDELVRVLAARSRATGIPAAALRRALADDADVMAVFDAAWPVLTAPDLLRRLYSDAALLASVAPTLTTEERVLLTRDPSAPWTEEDLPLLDAARLRLGDEGAAEVRRVQRTTLAAERAYMDDVIAGLMLAQDMDDGEGLWTMLRGDDVRTSLENADVLPALERDALAGPFAHVIVDEAQELTDAQWQMVLRRCPSRSVTVVGDRAQARHGFTWSWQERLTDVGLRSVTVDSLRINYRTPVEVMTEAEPVIRAAIPDANVPTSIRSSGIPVRRGSAGDRDAIVAEWRRDHPDGIGCVIGDPTYAGDERVRSLTPETAKGLEFDLVVLVRPHTWGTGVAGAVDRYVAMTRTTQQLVILT